jgi:hypothetical protein
MPLHHRHLQPTRGLHHQRADESTLVTSLAEIIQRLDQFDLIHSRTPTYGHLGARSTNSLLLISSNH